MPSYDVPADQDGVTLDVEPGDPAVVHWPHATPDEIRVEATGGAARFGFRGTAQIEGAGVLVAADGESVMVSTRVEATPIAMHIAADVPVSVTVIGYRASGELLTGPSSPFRARVPVHVEAGTVEVGGNYELQVLTKAPLTFALVPAAGGGGGGAPPPDATTDTKGIAKLLGGTAAEPSVPWTAVTGRPSSLPPSGGAGGVLSGTYPNPAFAVDMAEQSELVAGLAGKANVSHTHPAAAITDFAAAVSSAVVAMLEAGPHISLVFDPGTGKLTISGDAPAAATGYGTSPYGTTGYGA